GTLTFSCSLSASLSADCEVELLFDADWVWSTFCPPLPPEGCLPSHGPLWPLTAPPVAAAPWFWPLPCSVLLQFAEVALFSALLDWFTSPLFPPRLSSAPGTLTFSCSLSASLSADCEVELLLEAHWLWLTSWPPFPPDGSLPPETDTPVAAPP